MNKLKVYSFQDFRRLVEETPDMEEFTARNQHHLLNLWHMYGPKTVFDRLDEKGIAPETEEELIEQFDSFLRTKSTVPHALNSLFWIVDLYRSVERWRNVNPYLWKEIAKTKTERQKVKWLERTGYIDKCDVLVPRERLAECMASDDNSYKIRAVDLPMNNGLVMERLRERGYRIYVRHGAEASLNILEAFGLKDRIIVSLMNQYRERYQNLTGASLEIPSSKFEKEIERRLLELRIPMERHKRYNTLLDKNGKPILDGEYRMDVFIGDHVFEIIDEDDEFIHDQDYRRVIDVIKRRSAERGGYVFHVIRPGDGWEPEFFGAARGVDFSRRFLRLEDPVRKPRTNKPEVRYENASLRNTNPSRQNMHFWNHVHRGTHLKYH